MGEWADANPAPGVVTKRTSGEEALLNGTTDAHAPLTPEWQAALGSQLEPGEEPLAWFEPDLDALLRYDRGLVVLTARRVLTAEAGGARWQSLARLPGSRLRTTEHGGAGLLELLGPSGRLA